MYIRANTHAHNAHRNLKNTGVEQRRAANRLSSGFRINSAADDAAGLAVSEQMRAQIRGLDQALRNSQDGQALIQTADGGMEQVNAILNRIRELVVQAANDTYVHHMVYQYSIDRNGLPTQIPNSGRLVSQRVMIQVEIDQLMQEINSLANRVEFNTKRLLAGNIGIEHVAVSEGWHSQPPLIIDPPQQLMVHDILRTNHPLDSVHMRNLLNGIPFLTNYTSPFRFFDGTVLHDVRFNLETSLAAQDSTAMVSWAEFDSSVHDFQNLSFEEFVHHALFNSDIGDFADKAGHFVTRVAQALSAGLSSATNSNVVVAGEFSGGYAAWRVIGGGGLNVQGACTSPGGGASFGCRLLHLNASPDPGGNSLPVPGFDITEIPQEDIWVPAHTRTVMHDEIWLQLGANSFQGTTVGIGGMTTRHLHQPDLKDLIDVRTSNGEEISRQLDYIDRAMEYVNQERANLGAVVNRLEHTGQSLQISSENLQDAESRVSDADIAREMMALTMANVLQQAGVSMLAQSNRGKDVFLQLLR